MAENHNVTKVVTSDDGYCWSEVANRDSEGHIISDTYRKISDSYSQSEINAKLSSALVYKGSVSTFADLAAITDMKKGDVWNVAAAYGTTPAGTNWAWDGTAWDPLGGTVDLSAYVPTSRTINGHPLFGDISITKSDLALSQVDNTADRDKPVSEATQTALNAKVSKAGDSVTGTLGVQMLNWYVSGTQSVFDAHDFQLGGSATDPFLSFIETSGQLSSYTTRKFTMDYSGLSYSYAKSDNTTMNYAINATPADIILAANREYAAGDGLSVSKSDTVNQGTSTVTYSLNSATSTTLGGIKIGSGIDIDSGGVASAHFKKGEILTISW